MSTGPATFSPMRPPAKRQVERVPCGDEYSTVRSDGVRGWSLTMPGVPMVISIRMPCACTVTPIGPPQRAHGPRAFGASAPQTVHWIVTDDMVVSGIW